MFALLLFIACINAQPFMNMYGQQLPYAEEQDAFRAEQVLHGLNMKYMQLRDELYRTTFRLRGTQRRRYFSSSPIELYGSEHTVQFLKLKEFRLRRTIAIILKQMATVLTSINKNDRNMVVMHLGLPMSTINAMKQAIKAKVPEVPQDIPLVGPQTPFGFRPYY
ncbi:hypothetical protein EHI8A_003680 [Entamoeba histolytica HM-1:IMSS-B]|uniref:Uncharacterized protein n=8 Tax=Entamoeba TaxID=5758 RepID=C4LV54_ENTH1|nr:hypothetical protein ENU1_013470 [Entamoeba nuttalli P19]XP_649112.1 hypothetical protein EHI_182730 [Entamoeba histolytica HM-1:IMSS]EMD45057.1 Hypothetical protein EHI5A_001600 [Entamoeba histolytica KU27]EMH72306.1 hypothetical protein EHI8A_003680 [Entamoeba histolytica HM-1:IMSS-B]EMS10729.1 hypothetical protein KM1_002490 [Entamoeba histolytica HM-3:IMSS]ENY63617.1 hypothetical protein EHI7A_003660 [Entamoeba histolytica HM-1:IMSS-A]BAN39217.1 hypothetical protein [Entamoeba histolyt|eukprot:XP_008854965.1 hypothetical protein ENU1_013470 [Entamoeba nuttalli P19]